MLVSLSIIRHLKNPLVSTDDLLRDYNGLLQKDDCIFRHLNPSVIMRQLAENISLPRH
jgi:hypothetical protein